MSILIFGDSIVHGAFDSQGGWATRLVRDCFTEQLAHLDKDVPFVYNLGFSGDTTKHLAERLPAETEARFSLWSDNRDVAYVIAIGVNDTQVRDGKAVSSPEMYAKDLTVAYKAARRYSSKILLVGMAPMQHQPWADQWYGNERIWDFEQAQRAFVQDHSIPFVPLYELFQDGLAEGSRLLTIDGLHPSDAGHQLIYEQVQPAIAKLLSV